MLRKSFVQPRTPHICFWNTVRSPDRALDIWRTWIKSWIQNVQDITEQGHYPFHHLRFLPWRTPISCRLQRSPPQKFHEQDSHKNIFSRLGRLSKMRNELTHLEVTLYNYLCQRTITEHGSCLKPRNAMSNHIVVIMITEYGHTLISATLLICK